MVLEEVVAIYRESPQLVVVVDAHKPTAQHIALLVAINTVGGVLPPRYKCVPKAFKPLVGRHLHHSAVISHLVWIATKL